MKPDFNSTNESLSQTFNIIKVPTAYVHIIMYTYWDNFIRFTPYWTYIIDPARENKLNSEKYTRKCKIEISVKEKVKVAAVYIHSN